MPSIGIADKTTLDSVNTKVGTNIDGAGTTTLFARLAQIANYVDTLETLVGTASPTSGDLTTLFKGLKLIADYVDTLETKIGLNTDGAGTTTLFARLAQIADYTNNIPAGVWGYENRTLIKSIQRGVTEISGTSTVNVTISPVGIAKSFVISSLSNKLDINSGSNHDFNARVQLTSSTNLEIYKPYNSGGSHAYVYVAWQVIEFY